MTYRNRKLIRKPVALLRANEEEMPDFDFVVEYFGGDEPSAAYRKAVQEFAKWKRHEANSLAPRRVDRNAFGAYLAA
jgi:hypothetical protein